MPGKPGARGSVRQECLANPVSWTRKLQRALNGCTVVLQFCPVLICGNQRPHPPSVQARATAHSPSPYCRVGEQDSMRTYMHGLDARRLEIVCRRPELYSIPLDAPSIPIVGPSPCISTPPSPDVS